MKYTKYMRDAAALVGLPVNMWAARALHSAAFDVFHCAREALEAKGLRNANEIADREHEAWRKHTLRETNRRMSEQNELARVSGE
jgi:hypothetical protein